MKRLAVAFCALLAAAPSARAEWLNYFGNPFTTLGLSADHANVVATVTLTKPYSQYLGPNQGAYPHNILIDARAHPEVVFQVSDGAQTFSSDNSGLMSDPRTQVLFQTFLVPDNSSLNFTKGWGLSVTWCDSLGVTHVISSVYAGTTPALFGATSDSSAVGALTSKVDAAQTWWTHRDP